MRASLSSGFAGGAASDQISPSRGSQLGGAPGGRSFNIHYARLLTEQEINRVRDRFHEDTEFLLEEALRKHVRFYLQLVLAR